MAVIHLSFGSLNIHLYAAPQESSHQIHATFVVALQYEEATRCSILIKCYFCNFTLWMPCFGYPGPSTRLPPPSARLCTYSNRILA